MHDLNTIWRPSFWSVFDALSTKLMANFFIAFWLVTKGRSFLTFVSDWINCLIVINYPNIFQNRNSISIIWWKGGFNIDAAHYSFLEPNQKIVFEIYCRKLKAVYVHLSKTRSALINRPDSFYRCNFFHTYIYLQHRIYYK